MGRLQLGVSRNAFTFHVIEYAALKTTMLNENENTTTLETFIEYNMKMKRTSSVVARRLAKKNKAREMEV